MSTTSWDDVTLVQTGTGKAEFHSESGFAPAPEWPKPPVLKAGEFSPNDRVGLVRWPSGKTATFAGDLLKQALSNGATLVSELQSGKPGGSTAAHA
jgi:hypothetical protein